jgi:Family of unknown function (DUF5317)
MFTVYAVIGGILVGFMAGGRAGGLAELRIRWPWLIVAGMVAQVVLFSGPVSERVGDWGPPLYIASTLLVVVAVVRNLAIAGMPLVAAGAASNLLAVIANGGYMPASRVALETAGRLTPTAYSNSSAAENPVLPQLTDIFALPSWMPLANVFSVGDVLIGAGIGLVIVLAMRRHEALAEPSA